MLGFPDINSIEPLADVLGVSVLEIMRSERMTKAKIPQNTVSATVIPIRGQCFQTVYGVTMNGCRRKYRS